MKKQDLIAVIIIIVIIVFLLIGIVYFNFDGNKKNSFPNNKEESKMVFKDISFIDTKSPNLIKIYDNKYVIVDNKLYNLDGKMLFDGSNYDSIQYNNGYIIVEQNNEYGVIGKNYDVLIPIEYESIVIKSENCFLLSKLNNKNVLLTNIYNPKTKKDYGIFINLVYYSDKLIIFDKYIGNSLEEVDGLINSNLLETYILNIIEDKLERKKSLEDYYYSSFGKFQDNYFIASKFVDYNIKYAVLNDEGNEVIPIGYDKIENIDDKLLLIELNDTYKLITIDNQIILTNELNNYNEIYIKENIIVVEQKDGITKYYDLNGSLIYNTNDAYSYVDYINDNKYILNTDDKCVYIDLTDNVNKKEIDYSYCEPFADKSENGYIVRKITNDNYLYNNNLEQVFKNTYDDIILMDKYCIVKKEGKYQILSYNEKLLIDKVFSDYWVRSDNALILLDDTGKSYYFKY